MQDKKQKQQCKEEFEKERDNVAWTQEEDDILREQIGINGTENWAIIASKFKDKTTRQCRRRYTSKFDKVDLDKIVQVVSDLPDPVLHPPVKEAFDVTYINIYAFHAAQESPEKSVENMKFLLNQIICLLW